MTKITTSSSKITACPECDSGNLHVSGSEIECISCGWKHTAKKTRTTKAKDKPAPVVEQASIAAQLAAAVTQTNKDTAPYNLTKCPKCGSEELFTGRVDEHGIVQDEQLVGGCHACDWTYDVRSKKTRQVPSTLLCLGKPFRPRTNQLGQEGDPGRWAQNANWVVVTQYLQDHGNRASYADLVAAIQKAAEAGGYLPTCNARGFVQGRVRNGHLVAAQ